MCFRAGFAGVIMAVTLFGGELTDCRHNRNVSAGSPSWTFDGHGGLAASTDKPTTGTISLTCRVRFKVPAQFVTVDHRNVLVSFQPASTKAEGSGLRITTRTRTGDACTVSYTRVAGEDWIGSGRRSWSLPLPKPVREATVTLEMTDNSSELPVRVDVQGLHLEGAATLNAPDCTTPVFGAVAGPNRPDR